MKWRDVEAGATVVLKGQRWTVEKIKVKGKAVTVTVTGRPGTFTREVRGKDQVEVAPLYQEEQGQLGPAARQSRWATAVEHQRAVLDAERPTTPPKPPADTTSWLARYDKVEKRLERELGAVLIGQTVGEHRPGEYWVPVPDVSTIAAHLLTFHGLRADGATVAEAKAAADANGGPAVTPYADAVALADHAKMVTLHDEQHQFIEAGQSPANLVPHWHSTERPTP